MNMTYYAKTKTSHAAIIVENGIVTEFEAQIDFEFESGINLKNLLNKPFTPAKIWKKSAPFQAMNFPYQEESANA